MRIDDAYLAALERRMDQVYQIAERHGLDPFPINWEVVPAEVMYEFGAYGLPGRFSHWTHGRAYHRQKVMYDYGLSKIYELVINTNPSYAFLLDGNSVLQNTLIVAHVVAHVDFFKNNVYFGDTNRAMVEGASASADRIRRYEFQHGRKKVEEFLDAVLSIEEHIDPHQRLRHPEHHRHGEKHPHAHQPGPYEDLLAPDERPAPEPEKPKRIPERPEKDLLLFLIEHAPDLEDWQRDVIEIVRNEMLYFVPQMQTKIMNEGWASYWHSRIVRELELTDDEYVEFARMHSSVLAPSKREMNPYHVGLKIFEDVERRWNDPSEEERERFGRKPGQGREKIFEVRQLENDVAFLRNYLTDKLVEELDLYIYQMEGDTPVVVEKDVEKIRQMLVGSMTNFGVPYIQVEDGDYRKARELYLRHVYEGREIDIGYAERVLRYVHQIWGRPVHIETVLDNQPMLLTFDGNENQRKAA